MVVPTQGWTKCPRGELARLATRLRVRRLIKTALAVAAVVIATVATATAVQVAVDNSPGWFAAGHSGGGCSTTQPTISPSGGACHDEATK